MNWTLLKNSLLLSALTAFVAVALGLLSALFVNAVEWRWRRCLVAVAVLGLALPPFLVADCWLLLFEQFDWSRQWGPMSLGVRDEGVRQLILCCEAAWILALMFWPISLVLILGAWQRLEPGQLECEPRLVGWPLIRWLLIPTARDALTQAGVITFVLALNNFAVPALLQVKVFPAEVWVSFNTTFDYAAAMRLSWPLVLAPLLMLFWLRRRDIAWPRLYGVMPARTFRRQLGAAWFKAAGLAAVASLCLSVAVPLVKLCSSERTWMEFVPALRAGKAAVISSAGLAAGSAVLVVVVALVTWRWPIAPVTWLPFLVPGVLLGIALIVVFNRWPLSAFYQSIGIVLLAWSVRYLAVGWNTVAHALRSVDGDLTDAARLEGASAWQLLRYVHWPQVALQVAAAWYLTYLFCLWDAETLILIMPPGAETLSLRVFNFLHYGHNPQVNALCLVLLMLAIAPLCVFTLLGARPARRTHNTMPNWGSALRFMESLPADSAAHCDHEPARMVAQASCLWSRTGILPVNAGWKPAPGVWNAGWKPALHDRQDACPTIARFMEGLHSVFSGHWGHEPGPAGSGAAVPAACAGVSPATNSGARRPSGRRDACPTAASESTVRRRLARPAFGLAALLWTLTGCGPGTSPNEAAVESRLFNRVRVIGTRGAGLGEFNKPRSVAVDSQDNLYVVDMTGRVQKFSSEGTFLSFWQMPQTDKGKPKGMCRDEKGDIVVLEPHYSRVNHFTPGGKLVAQWGAPGTNSGELAFPRSVVMNSRGDVFVSEYGLTERVQQFTARGGKLIRFLGRGGTG
ncbi:MAG: ABC transporter permease subunit, partial [Verrucomicrobia bacterium]